MQTCSMCTVLCPGCPLSQSQRKKGCPLSQLQSNSISRNERAAFRWLLHKRLRVYLFIPAGSKHHHDQSKYLHCHSTYDSQPKALAHEGNTYQYISCHNYIKVKHSPTYHTTNLQNRCKSSSWREINSIVSKQVDNRAYFLPATSSTSALKATCR